MPEGLAQTMTDQELVDLLAYLATLRQPVSIVGQYSAIGPICRAGWQADVRCRRQAGPRTRSGRRPRPSALVAESDANAEGLADLSARVGGDPKNAAYACGCRLTRRHAQAARLVLDTPADVPRGWAASRCALEPRSTATASRARRGRSAPGREHTTDPCRRRQCAACSGLARDNVRGRPAGRFPWCGDK